MRHDICIHALTVHPATPAEWLEQIERLDAECRAVDAEAARTAHEAWWDAFWNRSWVRVTSSGTDGTGSAAVALGAA